MMNSSETAAAVVLSSACAAAAAWWWSAFRRVLPLEREAAARKAELDAYRAAALELLDLEAALRRPERVLEEAASRALSALQRGRPGLALAVLTKRPDGGATLAAYRGGAWTRLPLGAKLFDDSILARAASEGRAEWTLGRAPDADPLAAALGSLGFRRALLSGWSGAGSGAVVAAAADDQPFDFDGLQLAASALKSASAAANAVSELAGARERLQGGLSAAMQELTHAHDRLIRKSREIKTLHDVTGALTAQAAAPSALAAIVSIVARALEADLVAFLILDESTGELVTQPGAYGLAAGDLLYRIPLGDERSSSVRVFKTRRPFMTGDAQNDPGVMKDYAKLWRVHSLMVVPLVLGEKCIGVMRVGSKRAGVFGTEQLSLVTLIADEAAIIVETALLNRRLSKTTEQLTALNRMKDEFVSTVSHEFKTPLTTISGFLSVMLEGDTGQLNEQQMRFLTIAKQASKRLSGLVSDLLDLSRLESGAKMEPCPLDLEKLAAECLENHQPSAAAACKVLSCEVPSKLPPAWGDERWLALVLDNLVSNALKFSRSGGRVRVKLQDKGDFLMVSVSDDGIGVPPEDRDRVFERFYRASNRSEVSAPGTGLGLAIAREVVDKHGGKIWLESELGKGSTFHFVVPSAASAGVVKEPVS